MSTTTNRPDARIARAAAPRVGIVVNGAKVETAAETLAALLDELGYGGARIATAVNGDFVPERGRAGRRLAAGDRIEIVAPRQGG
jgi:sulfur carrier protein